LVNQALAKLLEGHNTTISIAHRLSTIKRSDRIIVIGSDGTIAEEGSYRELSANADGAFSKLMEWQMSGGEGGMESSTSPRPSEREEIEHNLGEEPNGEEDHDDGKEATMTRKDDVNAAEAVVERTTSTKDRS
jgi:putative ABC transport system ATP-binding protein